MDTFLLYLLSIPRYAAMFFLLVVLLAGIGGAIHAGMTRPDAFDATDRKPKLQWVGILLGCAVGTYVLSGLGLVFIAIFLVVPIGIYWLDVYPSLRDIQAGH